MKLGRPFALALFLLIPAEIAHCETPLDASVALFENGRFGEAQKGFAAYAAAHPRHASAAYWNGRAFMALRDFDHAIEWLEKATELAPRRADAFLALGRAYGRRGQQAGMLRAVGLAKDARRAWETVLAIDPTDIEARTDLLMFHLFAPGLMGGSMDEARRLAGEIASRDPIQGPIALARIAEHDKDFAGAERLLQEALNKNPGNAELRGALGLLLQKQERWDAAFATYDAMLLQDADAWEAAYQVGRTAALSGQRLDKGAAALVRYLGHLPGPDEPGLANAHYRLGMIRERQGNRDGARDAYKAAVRLDPSLKAAKEALEELD